MPSKRKTQEALAEMREAYSNYEPAYGETATDGADFLVNQITAALRDAVAGVDRASSHFLASSRRRASLSFRLVTNKIVMESPSFLLARRFEDYEAYSKRDCGCGKQHQKPSDGDNVSRRQRCRRGCHAVIFCAAEARRLDGALRAKTVFSDDRVVTACI